jgi:hypothetical protein
MPPVRLSIVAVAAVVAAACGDEPTGRGGPPVSPEEAGDVAIFVGDAVAEDVSLMRTLKGAFGVPSADAFFTGEWTDNCTYSATTSRFNCQVLSHEGRTVVRSYQLLDASGRPQPAYDAVTTASASFFTAVIGSVSRDQFSVSFGRERNITISGLAGTETQHTVNGTGASSSARTRYSGTGETRIYTMTSGAAISNVIVPFPRAQGSWPRSGTITRQVTSARDVAGGSAQPNTRTATVTFNGTQFVPLVVGGQTFTLDLATGTVSRASRAG